MVPFGWRQCWQERCRAGYFLAGAFGAGGEGGEGGEGGGVEGSGAHHALAIEGVTGSARALFRDTWLLLASASRVLMSTARRRVDAGHAPGEPAREVRVGLDGTPDPVPRAVRRPTPVPFTNGLTAARTLGKVPPRYAGPDPEQGPVDHPAVIAPASPTQCRRWRVRLQPAPLGIRQITPPHARQPTQVYTPFTYPVPMLMMPRLVTVPSSFQLKTGPPLSPGAAAAEPSRVHPTMPSTQVPSTSQD